MQPKSGTVLVGLAALALVVSASATPRAEDLLEQQPTFRSAVDLIAVDVQVVDSYGRPVTGLTPADFEVQIGGRRRRVVSADFTQYAFSGPPPERPGGAPMARNVWPEGQEVRPTGPPRTFVVAIDAASFSTGDTVGVIGAVNQFIDRLADQDLVGVFTLPHGTSLRPTIDRVAMRRSLNSVSGWQGMRANRYNLTPSEVMEITAEDGQMDSPQPVGRGGAAVPVGFDQHTVLRQVQLRECRGTNDASCLQGILMEASALGRQYEEQVAESLVGLNGLLGQLGEMPGRKTVVLVSAGMPVSDRPGSFHTDGGEARALGRAAAQANATVYSIHVDQGYRAVFAAEARTSRPTYSVARERELAQLLLNEFAVASGGALLSVSTGSGEFALNRLLFETSGYYLLGVAPDQLDLDGKTHELRVRVIDRRGVNIRSRRFVVLRPAS